MQIISDECKTKYPVFFVHGTGFRDRKIFNYWGAIPKLLKKRGACVFYSRHDAWANIEVASFQIVEALEKALTESGSEKVNVIAHSKGGIDVRYAISKLGVADKIASVTLISSPNHGSKMLDEFFSIFGEGIFKLTGVFVNLWYRILGDKKPDFFGTVCQFRASYMEKFNTEVLDNPSILVQSFAGRMKNPLSDILMGFLNFMLGLTDGDNDGLVSVESAKWGNFRGILEGNGLFGISHPQEVDGYRTNPKLLENEGLPNGSKTIRDFYVSLVRELKEKEF